MKLRFLPFLVVSLSTTSAFAQTAPALPSTPLSALPKFERLEGTITATSGGITSKARLSWEAPQKLRIDIEADPAALIDAQTIITEGSQTFQYTPLTKRVQRLPYNIATQWWRSWGLGNGGPANVLLFGAAEVQSGAYYTFRSSPKTVRLDAIRGVGQYWVRDMVRFGGGGDKAFHAAFKYPVLDRPAQIDLALPTTPPDGKTTLVSRNEADEKGAPLNTIAFEVDAASGLPNTATVREATKAGPAARALATFSYDLKLRAERFPADTFKLEAPGQIVEDAELKPLAEYTGTDAASLFSRGVVYATHVEEFAPAFASLDEAARLEPQATAPQFAIYDAALAVRDTARAEGALQRLTQLLGGTNSEVLSRRAQLATLLLRWPEAAAALDAAREAQPQDLGVLVQRAELHRSQGEFDAAQALLLEVLKSPLSQPLSQIDAAEILAAMSTPQLAAGLRRRLPTETQWQRLAGALLALAAGQEVGETNLTHDAARASLAMAQEAVGQDAPARPVWQELLMSSTPSLRDLARARLVGAAARRGDVDSALTLYHELLDDVQGEKAERALQDALIESWRKAFRQEDLRAALQQRATNPAVLDSDMRLWLAFQETNGTTQDLSVALQLALTRFPRSAWWYSRQAEYEINLGNEQSGDIAGAMARERLVAAAIRNVQKAIELDPVQPYYKMQRTLILTARANPPSKVLSGQRFKDRTTALKEVVELVDANPGDSDIMISAALQRLSLDTPGKHDASIKLLSDVLQGGRPGPEAQGDGRHVVAYGARQSLAMALRRHRQPGPAARQYDLTLDAAAGAVDQLGVSFNYLRLLQAEGDTNGVARLLIRIAREPWPFGEQQELIDGFVGALVTNRILARDVAALVRRQPEEHSRLAAAYLYQALARQVPVAPPAPRPPGAAPAPIFAPESALRELSGLLPELPALAESADKVLAARTAALLGEISLGASQPVVALQWFQKAVALEPLEPSLRLVVAFAHIADGNPEAALRVREDLLRILPPTTNNLLRLAALSRQLNLKDEATRLTGQAFGVAQVTPAISPGQMQLAAFAAARSAFAAGQTQRGIQIYGALTMPQWDWEMRAAAVLDLEKQARAAGNQAGIDTAAQWRATLDFSKAQLEGAELFLQGLD